MSVSGNKYQLKYLLLLMTLLLNLSTFSTKAYTNDADLRFYELYELPPAPDYLQLNGSTNELSDLNKNKNTNTTLKIPFQTEPVLLIACIVILYGIHCRAKNKQNSNLKSNSEF